MIRPNRLIGVYHYVRQRSPRLYHGEAMGNGALILLLFFCAGFVSGANEGKISGRTVDLSGSPIEAEVRILADTMGATIYRARADGQGFFHVEGVAPGTYALRLTRLGFSPEVIHGVVVTADSTTNIPDTILSVGPCHGPGVSCMCVPSCSGPRGKRAYLSVGISCAVDLEVGSVLCPPKTLLGANLFLSRRGDALYLGPVGRVIPSYPDHCLKPFERIDQVRIDGLGRGDEFCIATTEGRVSHVFLTEDVKPGDESVTIWYVNDR